MRRLWKTILGCICFASIILAGAENLDGSCNVVWTLGWMLSALVTGLGYKQMEEEAK